MIGIIAAIATASWSPPPCHGGDVRQCAQRDLKTAQARLRRASTAAIARIRACKPAKATACYDKFRAARLLVTEQRAWEGWRDAHCNVVAFGVEQTSAEGSVRAGCKTALTVKRIEELNMMGRR